MQKKSYLVTGGTGFIGSALVRKLVSSGHRVRVLDNNSRGNFKRLADLSSEIEIAAGDIRDAAVVSKAVKGMDAVCHLAFVNGTKFFYTKPELVLEVGVKGMVHVLDACIKHNVGELVLASSSEVYHRAEKVPTPENVPLVIPDPWNPRYSYAAGKIISEMMAISYGKAHFDRVLIFRPHNVYGPAMGWRHVIPEFIVRMCALVKQHPTGVIPFQIQGTGNETRSFVYIDDFTDGLVRVIKKGVHLGLYHIGTKEEVKISELAKLVAACFGRKIKIIPGKSAEGGTDRRCPDITKIEALGYLPKYKLKSALPIVTKWYTENIHLAQTLRSLEWKKQARL